MVCGQVDNQPFLEYGMRRHNQTGPRRLGELRNGPFDFAGIVHAERGDLYPQRHCGGFCSPQEINIGGCFRMQSDRYVLHGGCNFLKRLQPFSPISGSKFVKPVMLPPGCEKTLDKAPTDRVRNLQEHDRLAASCIADRPERGV